MATVRVTPVRKSPAIAEGMGVTEFLNDSVELCKSATINYNDTTGEVVFSVPANTEVLGVIIAVTTAFNGTIPSVSLGISGTTGQLVGTNDFDCTTIGQYAVWNKPVTYTSDTSLIATIVAGGGGTTGALNFQLVYRSRTTFLA